MNKITEFRGAYRFLSNFWPATVEYEGLIYLSTENAYQAAKMHPDNRKFFIACTPGEAKRMARKMPTLPNWHANRIPIMRGLLQQKFAPYTVLADMLRLTGDIEIIEGNTWGDTFWGVCNGKGENNLGKLIMEQRAYVKGVRNERPY